MSVEGWDRDDDIDTPGGPMTDRQRMRPPDGSEPEGAAFGKPYQPQPGVTFLAFGAFGRTIIDNTAGRAPRALVAFDLAGKWNHGAKDTLSVILSPEVAADLAEILGQCAAGAPVDITRYLQESQ